MLYRTECGCEIFSEELILTRKDGLKLCKRCPDPKHLGSVINRITNCIDCECEIIFSKSGPIQKRCVECSVKYHAKSVREKYRPATKNRKKKSKPKIQGHVKVFSVGDARRKGVLCIPCQKLFEV